MRDPPGARHTTLKSSDRARLFRLDRVLAAGVLCAALTSFVTGQSALTAPPAAASNGIAGQGPVSSTSTPFKISVSKNVVLLRVVVRDSKGQAVGNLRKEDFVLFDNGRPQEITTFSVEREAGPVRPAAGHPTSTLPRPFPPP